MLWALLISDGLCWRAEPLSYFWLSSFALSPGAGTAFSACPGDDALCSSCALLADPCSLLAIDCSPRVEGAPEGGAACLPGESCRACRSAKGLFVGAALGASLVPCPSAFCALLLSTLLRTHLPSAFCTSIPTLDKVHTPCSATRACCFPVYAKCIPREQFVLWLLPRSRGLQVLSWPVSVTACAEQRDNYLLVRREIKAGGGLPRRLLLHML